MQDIKKGSELIFISRILRDGSGTEMIKDQSEVAHIQNDSFEMNCLSITKGTYIASEFNSYVVKIKGQNLKEVFKNIVTKTKKYVTKND